MGALVLSVVRSGGGGSKEYLSINPDFLLLHHCYLFDTNFEFPGSGFTLQFLLLLAEMDTAFAASCLASTGTLTPEAVAYFSEGSRPSDKSQSIRGTKCQGERLRGRQM